VHAELGRDPLRASRVSVRDGQVADTVESSEGTRVKGADAPNTDNTDV